MCLLLQEYEVQFLQYREGIWAAITAITTAFISVAYVVVYANFYVSNIIIIIIIIAVVVIADCVGGGSIATYVAINLEGFVLIEVRE